MVFYAIGSDPEKMRQLKAEADRLGIEVPLFSESPLPIDDILQFITTGKKAYTHAEGKNLKHEDIADEIRVRVDKGIYLLGEKIPTEFELAEEFVVSRNTIRHALRTLKYEGVLISGRKSGTRVSNSYQRQIDSLER